MRTLFLSITLSLCCIAVSAQGADLRQMSKAQRNEYLIALAKEVTLQIGPDWYNVGKVKPQVTDSVTIFTASDQRAAIQRHAGRPYYRVTFYYDAATKKKVGWTFASYVDIWADDGEPAGIIFGHNYGYNFLFISYRDYIKHDAYKDTKMQFAEMKPGVIY